MSVGLPAPLCFAPGRFPFCESRAGLCQGFGSLSPHGPASSPAVCVKPPLPFIAAISCRNIRLLGREPRAGSAARKHQTFASLQRQKGRVCPSRGNEEVCGATELNPSCRATRPCASIPRLTAQLHGRREQQPFARPLRATQGPAWESAQEPARVRLLALNEPRASPCPGAPSQHPSAHPLPCGFATERADRPHLRTSFQWLVPKLRESLHPNHTRVPRGK